MLDNSTLQFLRDLKKNNSREWFAENRSRYDQARSQVEELVEFLLKEVGQIEDLANTKVKDCIFRIHRDIRFSKNKDPYKNHLAAAIGPGGRNSGRIDYYIHIEPDGESFLGGGMWAPTPEQLAKFRQEVDYNVQELKNIIELPEFRAYFPEIWGETLKTTPKGYPKDHPEIELLKRKQMFFMHKYSDQEVTSATFPQELVAGIRILKPYIDFLNYIFFDEPSEDQ